MSSFVYSFKHNQNSGRNMNLEISDLINMQYHWWTVVQSFNHLKSICLTFEVNYYEYVYSRSIVICKMSNGTSQLCQSYTWLTMLAPLALKKNTKETR